MARQAWLLDVHPLDSFTIKGAGVLPGVCGTFLLSLVAFGLGAAVMGKRLAEFAAGFCVVFLLGTLALVLAGQSVIKYYNLECAMWVLLVGRLISNTIGTPSRLRSAACTEFYIKAGLVLLGAEIVFGRLLALGLPGIFVSWGVTPIAFCVAVYWVTRVKRRAGEARPSLMEIWHRFPKFILGFVAASVVFSWPAVGGVPQSFSN